MIANFACRKIREQPEEVLEAVDTLKLHLESCPELYTVRFERFIQKVGTKAYNEISPWRVWCQPCHYHRRRFHEADVCYGQKNSCNSKARWKRPAPTGGNFFDCSRQR